MSFNSALILIIPFILLAVGFVCCCSSIFCRCRVRLFIWNFPIFLRYAYIARNFSLQTAFAVSHRFWAVVCSFSFISRNILISSLISLLTHSFFKSSLHEFECFCVFFLRLVSSLKPLWYTKILVMISIFLNFLRLVLCPILCLSLKIFHVEEVGLYEKPGAC